MPFCFPKEVGHAASAAGSGGSLSGLCRAFHGPSEDQIFSADPQCKGLFHLNYSFIYTSKKFFTLHLAKT
jgi:hypothetical protein